MKTMNIEKQLQMDREVSSIEKLTVSEGLQYKKEEDGIRAIGPLYLIGSYSDAEGSPVMIRELIDMDVFAPAEKLSEEEFHIDIGEVQAQPQGTQIDVVIELQISGIKEEQEEELADDGELVAVIAAAIAAYEGSTSTDGFVVRSIKRSKTNKWKRA